MIDHIPHQAIGTIVRQLFRAEVASMRMIEPRQEHGLWKIAGCNKNVPYIVTLRNRPRRDPSRRYLLRFNRGFRQDRYDHEAATYRLIAENTDIPTPRIYAIDRTQSVAPTNYMIMDYIIGDEGRFLAHPDNPTTDTDEKAEIERQMGYYTAQMHRITRPAKAPTAGVDRLLYRLEQLQHVTQDGQWGLDLAAIEACRRAVREEPYLQLEEECLLVADAELHFGRADGGWRITFICDTEWVDYGDPYSDLCAVLSGEPMWAWEEPLFLENPEELRERPFFQGYEELRPVDYYRLAAITIYYQLALWGSIADQLYRPEKREYMLAHEPLVASLLEIVASRAAQ